MQPESQAKRAIRRRLDRLPNLVLKANPQRGLGLAGVCDLDGCWEGRYLGIEVKTREAMERHGYGLSELQVHYALRVLEAGGLWMVCCDPKDAWEKLAQIGSDAYKAHWIAELRALKGELEAKWNETSPLKQQKAYARRKRLKPVLKAKIKEEAAEQHDFEVRWRARFGRRKHPIPLEILLYGLNPPRETQEP